MTDVYLKGPCYKQVPNSMTISALKYTLFVGEAKELSVIVDVWLRTCCVFYNGVRVKTATTLERYRYPGRGTRRLNIWLLVGVPEAFFLLPMWLFL